MRGAHGPSYAPLHEAPPGTAGHCLAAGTPDSLH